MHITHFLEVLRKSQWPQSSREQVAGTSLGLVEEMWVEEVFLLPSSLPHKYHSSFLCAGLANKINKTGSQEVSDLIKVNVFKMLSFIKVSILVNFGVGCHHDVTYWPTKLLGFEIMGSSSSDNIKILTFPLNVEAPFRASKVPVFPLHYLCSQISICHFTFLLRNGSVSAPWPWWRNKLRHTQRSLAWRPRPFHHNCLVSLWWGWDDCFLLC